MGSRLGRKLGILRRASAARFVQVDGGGLKGGKQVVNTLFKFLCSSLLFSPYPGSLTKVQKRNQRRRKLWDLYFNRRGEYVFNSVQLHKLA